MSTIITKKQFNNHIYKTEIAGRPFSLEFGKVAELANASAMVRYGDTSVLVAVTAAPRPRDGVDFFPLSVDFEEKLYAVGRIPGSFMRREGQPSLPAVLASRVIDRSIRPLFPGDFRNDVVVTCTVMSVDRDCSPEAAAMVGVSACLAVSNIPWGGPIGCLEVGYVDGQIVMNPNQAQKHASKLDLTVAATGAKVVMIEAGADQLPDEIMYEAIVKAHEEIKAQVDFINAIVAEIGKEKMTYDHADFDQELFDKIVAATMDEAKALQTVLESGSLPVSFEYAQSQTVGPTLGQDALASGVLVAAIGLALVMLYLLVFYHGLGLITAAAMAVFACLYLGILALLSHFGLFSLSMAGIAGVVLTIGMAADSSILTLERFREEIRMGRSVRAASITGVRHGILTSIDADLVTLVSALTLFFLASASVKGFGLTLALGILCDIAMMLLFKAPIIRLLAPRCIAKHPGFWGVRDCENAAPYFQGEKRAESRKDVRGRFIKLDINVLGLKKYFLSAAAVAMVLVAVIIGVRGLQFGIEFVGGTSVTFHGTGDTTIEQVRDAFDDAGVSDPVLQTTNADGDTGILARMTTTSAEDATHIANQVADEFGWSTDSFEVTTIGPDWGASVVQSSLLAFLVSLILIIAYISIRFRDYKMGVSAVIALLHDLVLVFGVYALVGREVTPNTIAALLTILGYSLYDTVVVFHRINENMKDDSVKCTFATMANHSVNEVLIRSLNTSITSLIPVVAMLLFGGETLKDFALAMTVGLIAGAYSSYAIATPIYVIWKTRETRYAKLQRKYGDTVVRWFLNRLPQPVKAVGAEGSAASAAPIAANATASTAPDASVEASAEGSSENATVVAAAQPAQATNRAANHATHRQKSNRSKSANRKKK